MHVDPFVASIADFARLPMPGAVLELDGTIVAVNAAGERLLARPAAQMIGRKAWDFAPGAEHIWAGVVASARAADYHGEIAVATPEGPRQLHYLLSLREHGTRTVVLLFSLEIRAVDDDRAQRLESLGMVAGGIAHDFNNQLVSVLAEASSMREDSSLPVAVQESLRRIEGAAQRMALLTRQLLAYAGRGRFVTELLDPDAMLAEMAEPLQRTVRADAELVFTAGAGGSTIEADRTLLREVITNLVVNASEALREPGGKIRIASSRAPRDAGQSPWWVLEVSDEGVGMDSRTVARIFDPFFTTKNNRDGLGLSAVHGIVRRFGGAIAVDSKPGAGTTFHVRLPTVSAAAPRASDAPESSSRGISLRNLSVLVADDEPTVRSTVRRLLERRGARVSVAADGEEAAVYLRDGAFDLVVLDVMMPKLTGYQLVPIARRAQPRAKVMLMSGYSDAARTGNADAEADTFLEKPFTAKQIDDAIDKLLER